jgi:hypothetical protein
MAYDFDHAGLVSARYAKPDYRLPIKTIQQRLYTGPCASPAVMAAAIERFKASRAQIEGLYVARQGLDGQYAEWARSYISDFYRTIEDPDRVKSGILRTCKKDGV